MIYKLTGITLPIAEIHCDKRQQMLNSTNQPLKIGPKKKKKKEDKKEEKFIYKGIQDTGYLYIYISRASEFKGNDTHHLKYII